MANEKSVGATLIDRLYQEIGSEARAVAGGDLGGRLLVYAVVADRVHSADLLYTNSQGDLQLVVGPRRLGQLVYELWKEWKQQPGNEEWRVMSYIVDPEGEITIDLIYPEDVDGDELLTDRRPNAVKKYFGDVKVIRPAPFTKTP